MDHKEQIKLLEKELPNFDSRDQRFGISLVDQWKTRGGLSERQWPYVTELLTRRGIRVDGSPTDKPQARRTVEMGDLSRINKLFDEAVESGLKYPKIRFMVGEDEIILARAGRESKFEGTINIKCEGIWHGRIDRKGVFTENPTAPAAKSWLDAIKELSESPMEALAAQGRKTGSCALCGITLTNHESIELGIGPICAGKWGVS